MLNVLQIFRKNASLFASNSMLMLLLAMAVVFWVGCSAIMPCPDTNKAAKVAKKTKKKKVQVPAATPDNAAPADDSGSADASAELPDGEAAAAPATKTIVTGKKNRYSKNGLLQGKHYKRLRGNPAKKTTRRKNQSIFSKLFSGNKAKKKTKTKRSTPDVSPDEQ
jgi:hypothetical protein